MIYSWGAKSHHETFKLVEPRYNDVVGYSSKWLMDDGVVVEAEVGVRSWLGVQQLERSMGQVWGAGAVNAEKKHEEGQWSERQLLWRLNMDVQRLEVALPKAKCVEASYLVATPEPQWGS